MKRLSKKTGRRVIMLFIVSLGIVLMIKKLYPHKNIVMDSISSQDISEEKELFVLGSYHEDMIKGLTEMYADKYQVKIEYVRMSTQDAEAKLIAEKDQTKFDVWMGGTVDAHEILKRYNILMPCPVKAEENIPQVYQDRDRIWKAQYIEVLSIGINLNRWEKEFAPKGISKPQNLEDLLNPMFKGEIIMPNPETSGTGYTFLASVLSEMGEEKGWQYLTNLNNQVGQYTYSGYTPAEKVGLGEYLICVNFLSDQQVVNSNGYQIESYVYDNAGWTIVPISAVSKENDQTEVKRFIEFCLSKEASELLVALGNVLVVHENELSLEKPHPLDGLNINTDFHPIYHTIEKENIIFRFLELIK